MFFKVVLVNMYVSSVYYKKLRTVTCVYIRKVKRHTNGGQKKDPWMEITNEMSFVTSIYRVLLIKTFSFVSFLHHILVHTYADFHTLVYIYLLYKSHIYIFFFWYLLTKIILLLLKKGNWVFLHILNILFTHISYL